MKKMRCLVASVFLGMAQYAMTMELVLKEFKGFEISEKNLTQRPLKSEFNDSRIFATERFRGYQVAPLHNLGESKAYVKLMIHPELVKMTDSLRYTMSRYLLSSVSLVDSKMNKSRLTAFLCELAIYAPQIKVLDLRNTCFDDEVGEIVTEYFPELKMLKRGSARPRNWSGIQSNFYVEGRVDIDAGLRDLPVRALEYLKDLNIKSVSLRGMALNHVQLQKFIIKLSSVAPNLRHLDLTDTAVDTEIIDFLARNFQRLEELKLRRTMVGNSELRALIPSFSRFNRLKLLDLSFTRINENDVGSLAKLISHGLIYGSLEKISIYDTSIYSLMNISFLKHVSGTGCVLHVRRHALSPEDIQWLQYENQGVATQQMLKNFGIDQHLLNASFLNFSGNQEEEQVSLDLDLSEIADIENNLSLAQRGRELLNSSLNDSFNLSF